MHINKLSKKNVSSSVSLYTESLPFKNTIIICSTLSIITCSLFFVFLNKYAFFTLPNIKVSEISWKIVSSIHGFYAFFFAGLYLTKYISLTTWRKLLSFSIGYFIFDLTRNLLFNTFDFHAILEPCVHHTVVVIIIINYLYKYPRLSALGFLSEFTTPILYTSWYLLKGGYEKTGYFTMCAVCLLIGFTVCRVFNFTRIYWELSKKKTSTFELVCFGSIVLINYYWFIRLIHKWIAD